MCGAKGYVRFILNSDRKSGDGISKPKILSGSVAAVCGDVFGGRQGAEATRSDPTNFPSPSRFGAVGVLSRLVLGSITPS
jgi:hypothetical protein